MLKGKVALITGANRGIGRQTALLFARNGAHVILNARTEGSLAQVHDEITAAGGKADCVYFSVSCPKEVKRGFNELLKISKRLDILVNNAGILRDALLGMVNEEMIREVFETNVFGVLYCSQYAARLMARNGSGSIINMSSVIGRYGNSGQSVYGGSKAAVIGITTSLAKELAEAGIRVNAIAPGVIDTDMIRNLPAEKFESLRDGIKMNRLGDASDVAKAALFLASDLSDYITGQVIGVDGGIVV